MEEKFVSRAGIAPTLTSDELFNSSDSESDEDEDNGFGVDNFNVEDMEEIEPAPKKSSDVNSSKKQSKTSKTSS